MNRFTTLSLTAAVLPSQDHRELSGAELNAVAGAGQGSASASGKTFLAFTFGLVMTTKVSWTHDD